MDPTKADRIGQAFARRNAQGQKVLVTYLCVGDPTLDESVDLAVACAEAGADILELGSPYSDPSADGPAIARASERAIKQGGGLLATLDAAAKIRARSDVAMIVFGYYNPVFVLGENRVAAGLGDAGADGVLLVDLPIDEGDELRSACSARRLHVIPLVTPTTAVERAPLIAARAPGGFLYYVSVAGITGAKGVPLAEASAQAQLWGERTKHHAVVGFGIDTEEKARTAAAHADGVVVGTALVRAIEQGASTAGRLDAARALVGGLRRALDSKA
jgi:tryptophan synthase alpha chain